MNDTFTEKIEQLTHEIEKLTRNPHNAYTRKVERFTHTPIVHKALAEADRRDACTADNGRQKWAGLHETRKQAMTRVYGPDWRPHLIASTRPHRRSWETGGTLDTRETREDSTSGMTRRCVIITDGDTYAVAWCSVPYGDGRNDPFTTRARVHMLDEREFVAEIRLRRLQGSEMSNEEAMYSLTRQKDIYKLLA